MVLAPEHQPAAITDPRWFKTCVFYEVLVRSFKDSDGDGMGDFAGLASKVDYLQWLGVDCVWLPPFFPSPLADGGYDVAEYRGVAPELGTLADFRAFVDGLHARGMRIIIDFVMNHTSDQHPWFQASRNDPSGPYGDYYVWRDAPDEYLDARIIFLDTEPSNWTFDPVRRQYFWHRFFSHQPDLNFDNPKVLAEMLDALRFWLDLGIDGFRLDAVPYLIERDGTNCENLPGTHDILKQVRAMVDAEYPGRILLCEANQWPRDVVEYFGDNGDECQMAFHFPVMPRLYMALKQHSRESISAILADTPAIPETCQWGTFLRNHDELTLEMVSPQERDFMWAAYAPDPRMKCNLGIRRRLAALVDNDQRRIKLLHAELLSLPGSPVLYYGDEIGMGDNIWLNDRDGVRTPMQWSDSPAGFSAADPARFYQPMLEGDIYGPTSINVAEQRRRENSLLRWLRQVLAIRKQYPVFGTGSFSDLGGENLAVLSYLRRDQQTAVLCVNNQVDSTQQVELSLPEFAADTLADLLGGQLSAVIDSSGRLSLTVPPYGYAWFLLRGAQQR